MKLKGGGKGMSDRYWVSNHKGIARETLPILNEYLLSLKLENKAKATIVKYKWIMERFLQECTTPIELLTSEHVLTWLNKFTKDKKPRTIDLYLSCLSTFFQFCLEEELMDRVILKKRWRPRIPDSLPKYLTEEDYARVRLAAEELPARDRALVLFLFTSGCRRGELCGLLIEDIDFGQQTAKVVGKGSRIRSVHFSTECSIALKEYLNTRDYKNTEPLFMNKFGQPLGPSGVHKILNDLGKKVGLSQSLHPHVCRHTFATNMLARGADLGFIAEEMGHTDLNTTLIYARIPTEDMISAYQRRME